MNYKTITLEIAGLRRELQELRESFQKKKKGLLTVLDEKISLEDQAEEVEAAITCQVSLESDENGKKIYSNEALRSAEIRRRLKNNLEYETLKEQLDFLEKQERALKTDIEILDRRFRIIEQLVVLLMVEGHLVKPYCQEVDDHERDT